MKRLLCFLLLPLAILQGIDKKHHRTMQKFPGVSFEEGMHCNYDYNPLFASQDPAWNLLEGSFTSFIKNVTMSQEPRIPKIIHVIWLGSPLPDGLIERLKTWQMHHKEWYIKIWQDKEIEEFGLQNKPFYDQAVNWGEKSDIARYEILYREGGVYIDQDFICLRSFDILHHICDFYTGIAYNRTALLYNGLIGAAPGHPIMKACIDNMVMFGDPRDFDAIMSRTGPGFFTRMFFKAFCECKKYSVLALPTSYFYPFAPKYRFQINKALIQQAIQPQSFALHLFAASWTQS